MSENPNESPIEGVKEDDFLRILIKYGYGQEALVHLKNLRRMSQEEVDFVIAERKKRSTQGNEDGKKVEGSK